MLRQLGSDHDIIGYDLELMNHHGLTLKHWEMHGCIVSTVATHALVLKHQSISIHNTD